MIDPFDNANRSEALEPDVADTIARPISLRERRVVWPEGNGRVYVGCEAGVMRRIRKNLIETAGFERTRITTRGYWRVGAANHPDRDYGDD
jgi:NADPH-dependent ferric siderophore reductase